MKVVIVDDNQEFIEYFSHLLKNVAQNIKIVGVATSIAQAVTVIQQEKPQLLFLDVQLASESATSLDLLKQLDYKQQSFKMIFVSGYLSIEPIAKRILTAGFELIGKPIDPIELKQTIKRAIQIRKTDFSMMIDILLSKQQKKITIKHSPNEMRFIKKSKIIKIVQIPASSFIRVDLVDDIKFQGLEKLHTYKSLLSEDGFAAADLNTIVNLLYVNSLDLKMGELILKNGEHIKIARRYMKDLKTDYVIFNQNKSVFEKITEGKFHKAIQVNRSDFNNFNSDNCILRLYNKIIKSFKN